MKALTLHQPWASAIAVGPKRIENRTWLATRRGLRIGERFAIHAGLAFNDDAARHIEVLRLPAVMEHARANRGSIIAVATLFACGYPNDLTEVLTSYEQVQDWYIGPVAWVLSDVCALPAPVQCKGAQGLWRIAQDVEASVLRQISGDGGQDR